MFFRRSFFTTQPTLMKWIGYKKEKLTWPFEQAVVKYKKNGAVKVNMSLRISRNGY
jgi:hypothetical protein